MSRKAIKESNKNFKKATKAEKRVSIMRDVLKQIKLNKVCPAVGRYFEVTRINPVKEGESLQKVMKSKTFPTCDVCMIGAAFYSSVSKYNQYKLSEDDLSGWGDSTHLSSIGEDAMRPFLRKFFTRRQLTLIESAFEKSDMFAGDNGEIVTDSFMELIEKAVEFGEEYNDSSTRMKAIANNIIKNGGTFRP